jgi:threonine dehydratase
MAFQTPLRPSHSLSERLACPVFLKIETVQPTGAFKLRGAANKVLALTEAERARGFVTVVLTRRILRQGRSTLWRQAGQTRLVLQQRTRTPPQGEDHRP